MSLADFVNEFIVCNEDGEPADEERVCAYLAQYQLLDQVSGVDFSFRFSLAVRNS